VIIPLRHVASFFEVTDKERKSLMSLLEQARNELQLRTSHSVAQSCDAPCFDAFII
jgi:diadenosine tetraphosphate (Ap4A) HIT family hydrolase